MFLTIILELYLEDHVIFTMNSLIKTCLIELMMRTCQQTGQLVTLTIAEGVILMPWFFTPGKHNLVFYIISPTYKLALN